jgi:hypothetical protein
MTAYGEWMYRSSFKLKISESCIFISEINFFNAHKLSSHWTKAFSILRNVIGMKLWTITGGGRTLKDELANFNFQNYKPKLGWKLPPRDLQ